MVFAVSLAPVPSTYAEEAPLALEEIVVTAQKRAENLQLAPVSVAVLSGELLEQMGVRQSAQLAEVVPNLSVRSERPGQSFPFIRGVGTPVQGLGLDQGVAVYVDGVRVDSPVANLVSVLDLERVEVLRGPQGTLYGRNAIGGVINLVTRTPEPTKSGRVRLGLGNYSLREIGVSGEGALVPGSLTGRASVVFHENRDGWYRNDAVKTIGEHVPDNGATDSGTARMILRYEATERLMLRLSGDYTSTNASGPAWQPLSDVNALAKSLSLQGLDLPIYSKPDGDIRRLSHNIDSLNDSRFSGGGLTVNYRLSERSDLTSVTGYRSNDIEILEDIDASPFRYLEVASKGSARSFSQEFRYHYSDDGVEGIVGLYYDDASVKDQISLDVAAELLDAAGSTQPGIIQRDTTSDTLALFSQWDWAITDRTTLVFGARWSRSEKTSRRREFVFTELALSAAGAGLERCFLLQPGVGPGDQPECLTVLNVPGEEDVPLPPNIVEGFGRGDWSHVTPRLGLRFQVHDRLMTYATFTQGYRDGGIEGDAANFREFGDETLDAWEIGMKSDWSNGRLRINGALFYYDYQDLQIELSQLKDQLLVSAVFNAGEAELRGGELESSWLASDMLQLSLNVGWLDSEITELDRQDPDVDFGFVAVGNEFPRAPRWTLSFVPDVFIALPRGTLTWRSEFNYKDHQFRDFENGGFADGSDARTLTAANLADGLSPEEAYVAPGTLVDSERMNSRLIVNSSVAYRSGDDRFELTLWVRNLLDEEYFLNRDFVRGLAYSNALYGAPRTYGASVNIQF